MHDCLHNKSRSICRTARFSRCTFNRSQFAPGPTCSTQPPLPPPPLSISLFLSALLPRARAWCRLRREIKLFPNRPSYADMRHARNTETIISWLQQCERIRRKQSPPSGCCTVKPPTSHSTLERYRKLLRKTAWRKAREKLLVQTHLDEEGKFTRTDTLQRFIDPACRVIKIHPLFLALLYLKSQSANEISATAIHPAW